jgi:hypothetical protein
MSHATGALLQIKGVISKKPKILYMSKNYNFQIPTEFVGILSAEFSISTRIFRKSNVLNILYYSEAATQENTVTVAALIANVWEGIFFCGFTVHFIPMY